MASRSAMPQDYAAKIDWPLLRAQKLTLLLLSRAHADANVRDHLNGVIHLIDAIQDAAVAEQGLAEAIVFGDLKTSDEAKEANHV